MTGVASKAGEAGEASVAGSVAGCPMPGLADLPDDLVRCVLLRCTTRSRVCLASTCTRFRCLARETPPTKVSLTCRQHPSVLRWLWSTDVAPWVQHLVARRCLYTDCVWVGFFHRLETLHLAFCRVRIGIIWHLPTSLRHVEIHTLVPPPPLTRVHLTFQRFKALRVLKLSFAWREWDAVFVAKLPKGLRVLHLRGGRALAVQSFVPKGLREVQCHASFMVLFTNRLPNGVRRVALECDGGAMWLRDVLPIRPTRLQALHVRCPSVGFGLMGRLARMRRLRALTVACDTLVVSWPALASLLLLQRVELRVAHWLGASQLAPRPPGPLRPCRVVVTVDHVDVTGLVAPDWLTTRQSEAPESTPPLRPDPTPP